MYERCSGVFDAVNERYDLRGADRACTFDDAMWHTLQRRSPREGWCVEDIDTDALNEMVSNAHIEGVRFNVPLELLAAREERRVHDEEPAPTRSRARRRRRPLDPRPRDTETGGGPGWPLSGFECVDRLGRLTPCSSPEAFGSSGRVVYRPRVAGERLGRLYLDADDEAVSTAAEERSTRFPLRAQAVTSRRRLLDFDPLDFESNPSLDRFDPWGSNQTMARRRRTPPRDPRTGFFLSRRRRRSRARRNPSFPRGNPMAETALLVNPSSMGFRRRRRRPRRNPLNANPGAFSFRRARRVARTTGMGQIVTGVLGGLAYSGAFLLVRKLVLQNENPAEREAKAKAWDQWRPFVKLGIGVGGWLLFSTTRWSRLGSVLLFSGIAHATTDILGPVFRAKGFDDVATSRPTGTGFDELGNGGASENRALAALNQLMLVREQQLRDTDDELSQDDDDPLAQDDDELEGLAA